MVCNATLTGSVEGFPLSATVTTEVINSGQSIRFEVTNLTPGTLIDEFFIELDGPFLNGLMMGIGTEEDWYFESDPDFITPASCGQFRYKFGTNVPDARIAFNQTATFFLAAPIPGTFTEDVLDGEQACVRVQQVGPNGELSGCACGPYNCLEPTPTPTPTPAPTPTPTPSPPILDCPMMESIIDMEAALAETLNIFVQYGDLDALTRVTKLIIEKEILLGLLANRCSQMEEDG
ncbi:hypothetical protein [Fervidibacillus halotolerans]|uniref:Uncharacterized protein n=1 Tax=Fervidibacillus halotolerans TaxID=2980027 RepID=A0A9E8M0J8_9BACI|nr:hypothetical protein [Fervidibacillus halotolerans]WAA13137.1 hypothetical protein OE105_03130 [Fervidibacillus halotolerans]